MLGLFEELLLLVLVVGLELYCFGLVFVLPFEEEFAELACAVVEFLSFFEEMIVLVISLLILPLQLLMPQRPFLDM